MADCVEHGGLPKLTTLDLRVNHVGDAGLRSLADACAAGGLPLLSKLLVVYNHITLIGFTALSDAKARGGLSRLKELLVHSMDGLEPEYQRVLDMGLEAGHGQSYRPSSDQPDGPNRPGNIRIGLGKRDRDALKAAMGKVGCAIELALDVQPFETRSKSPVLIGEEQVAKACAAQSPVQ